MPDVIEQLIAGEEIERTEANRSLLSDVDFFGDCFIGGRRTDVHLTDEARQRLRALMSEWGA
jgi:hypothetical protein